LPEVEENLADLEERCARCRPIQILKRPTVIDFAATQMDSKLNLFEQMEYSKFFKPFTIVI
jgi:hypothetical protein